MAFLYEETLKKFSSTADDLLFLLEADEDPDAAADENTDGVAEDSGDVDAGADDLGEVGTGEDAALPDEENDQEDSDDPNEQVDVQNGEFISDLQKGDIAKTMLAALMATPPPQGTIPFDVENVTTENGDQVIKFVRSAIALGHDKGSNELTDELSKSVI